MSIRFRNYLGIEFLWIDSGEFMMGASENDRDAEENELPRHKSSVEQDFYLAAVPVTLGQYEKLTKYKPRRKFAAWDKTHAVNYISCEAAEEWIDSLNASRPLEERKLIYRLPHENEWEYACRAGANSRFCYGDDLTFTKLAEYAWFADNTWKIEEKHPHPVGQKLPNALGLFDMHGNVWEWTADGWATYSDIIASGDEVRNSKLRVLRGGGWCHDGKFLRSSDRDYYELEYSHYYTGFRVAATLRRDIIEP